MPSSAEDVAGGPGLSLSAEGAPGLTDRAPGGRELLSVSPSDVACCGRALETFALAQLAALEEDAKGRGAPLVFTGEGPDGRPWLTFAAVAAGAPRRGLAAPVVVTLGAKAALAGVLLGVADLAGASPTASAEKLAESPWREASLPRLLLACRAGAGHLLRSGPLSRDLDLAVELERRFGALARSRGRAGGSALASLFLGFVKVLAWHAAMLAWQRRGRLTLNAQTLFGIIGSLEACHPLGVAAREALDYLRERLECWERARPRPRPRAPRGAPPAEPPRTPEESPLAPEESPGPQGGTPGSPLDGAAP